MKYENILVEQRDNVGLITLHRPKALNALCAALMDELTHAIEKFDGDDAIGCMVLTGSEKPLRLAPILRKCRIRHILM